jgi:uncharacterized protein YciI
MKKYYALKLIPPRPGFGMDMTQEERDIMTAHVGYWKTLMDKGHVVVFGPVLDPQGVYGLGIVGVDDEQTLAELIAHDPANGLNHYEYYPMMAVVPDK